MGGATAASDLHLIPILEASRPDQILSRVRSLVPDGGPLRIEQTRVQPPLCYWAVYRDVTTGQLLTFKSFFSGATFADYREQIDALHISDVLVLPDLNAVVWRYPFDPSMPGLSQCLDGDWVAGVLGREPPLVAEPRHYNPEISSLIAYRNPRTRRVVAYGKVAPQVTCGLIHLVMDRLWRGPEWRAGPVRVAQPLAYRGEIGLLLQAPVPGTPLLGNRNSERFAGLVDSASWACSALHAADLPFGPVLDLTDLLGQLEAGLEDLTYTAPSLLPTLRRLLDQFGRVGHGQAPGTVPSHGDFKYDQLLEHQGRFALIDFERFCQAEPAFDVGTFCAYLPPSAPRDWRESTAAEVLRARFLQSMLESNDDIPLERVALFEAALLGLRALSQIWAFQRGWQMRASGLLDLAFDRLADPEPRADVKTLASVRNQDWFNVRS